MTLALTDIIISVFQSFAHQWSVIHSYIHLFFLTGGRAEIFWPGIGLQSLQEAQASTARDVPHSIFALSTHALKSYRLKYVFEIEVHACVISHALECKFSKGKLIMCAHILKQWIVRIVSKFHVTYAFSLEPLGCRALWQLPEKFFVFLLKVRNQFTRTRFWIISIATFFSTIAASCNIWHVGCTNNFSKFIYISCTSSCSNFTSHCIWTHSCKPKMLNKPPF